MDFLKGKKIGLALGSGGARGLVHLGVLRCLEDFGIELSFIAGSSIGACVGAMYAAGQSLEDMENVLLEDKWKVLSALFDPTIFSGGFVKGDRFGALLREWISVDSFEDLNIPFACVASDLLSGDEICFSKGALIEPVRASMAVPSLFTPVKFEEYLLVDAGIVNPVPDNVVRDMGADFVISVNLDYRKTPEGKESRYNFMTNVNLRALNMLRHYLAEYSMSDSDIILNPKIEDAGLIGLKSYVSKEKSDELLQMGYDLMKGELEKLENLKL